MLKVQKFYTLYLHMRLTTHAEVAVKGFTFSGLLVSLVVRIKVIVRIDGSNLKPSCPG